jgi:hypothetical protein
MYVQSDIPTGIKKKIKKLKLQQAPCHSRCGTIKIFLLKGSER